MATRVIRRLPKPHAAKPPKFLNIPLKPPAPGAVEILTGDILQLMGAANKQSVAARAEVGKMLLAVKQALPHGSWQPYLKAHLPFTPRSAERAIALHHFSESHPALFDKIAPLGIAKAYFLITLPPAQTAEVIAGAHHVPSADAVLTPNQMTFRQLFEVVQGTTAADVGDIIAHNLERHLRAVGRAVEAAIAQKHWISQDQATAMHDALIDAAARLARAYRIAS